MPGHCRWRNTVYIYTYRLIIATDWNLEWRTTHRNSGENTRSGGRTPVVGKISCRKAFSGHHIERRRPSEDLYARSGLQTTYVPSLCMLQTAYLQSRRTKGKDKEEGQGTWRSGRNRQKEKDKEEEQGKGQNCQERDIAAERRRKGNRETDEGKRIGKEKNNETGKGKRQKDGKRKRNDKRNNETDRLSHCPLLPLFLIANLGIKTGILTVRLWVFVCMHRFANNVTYAPQPLHAKPTE